MSITASEMTPADIAAVTNNNCGSSMGWGGDWSSWIIIFLIFAFFGFGRNGGFAGGNSGGGVVDGYVLSSDFSNIERKIDGVNNGLCDGFYAVNTSFGNLNNTLAQNFAGVQNTLTQGFAGLNTGMITQGYETRNSINGIGTQLAQCCCDIREGISGVNYNLATQANGIVRQLERGFADTNYNMATQNCATLTAIDKVGDRIIDYMSNEKMQTLRDENQALRLAASQQAQNAYLVQQLGQKCPEPAYLVCNPNAPLNYSVNYGGNGCGCGA